MCHGAGGDGIAPHFPAIVQQPIDYVATQLVDWQQGRRSNDPGGLMKSVALKLTADEIGAVAAWLAYVPAAAVDRRETGSAGAQSAPRSIQDPEEVPHGASTAPRFAPPPEAAIPDSPLGDMIRLGRDVFVDTQTHAKPYVGNGLNCVNCHLDAGRLANSAPLWAAYVAYPAYRTKNKKVNTYEERLEGCFVFSMNGSMPPPESDVVVALVSYSYWLASGAPTGAQLAGRGYPEVANPPLPPEVRRGAIVYNDRCAICHGADGNGTRVGRSYVFPPVWGAASYNAGAGMHRVNTAAAFIKANMPPGQADSLTDQQAFDVAAFIDSQERPPDPRLVKSQAGPGSAK
jgi:thiosulfate dehydrogenase